MRQRDRIWLGLGTLALSAALAWAFRPEAIAVEVATATMGRFEQTVIEEGRAEVRTRYTLSTPVPGRLIRLDLREGDPVRAGQVIARLLPLPPPLRDARSERETQARLLAADAAVTAAQARLAAREAAHSQAQRQLARSERLTEAGFLSPAAVEGERLAAQAAAREWEAAQAEGDMAWHARAQAAAALDLPTPDPAERPGSRMAQGQGPRPAVISLRAPAAGRVLAVHQTSEASLAAGSAVLTLGDPGQLEVVAEFLTQAAVGLGPGTTGWVEGWGGPPVPVRVQRVEPSAQRKVSALGIEEQRVKVHLEVPAPPPGWQQVGDGFRVTVRLITREAEAALLVPVGSVFPARGGGYAVYRPVQGRARLQPVEVVARNDDQAWVSRGLQPGDAVLVYPPATLSDGRRIRVRPS